jgi:prepilin-type N-terminal cleavage/methylation domain-containing protein
MPLSNKRVGFTLVEMLVVITIIGVLVGLLLPAINMARESARQTQCTNNQQELGKAIIIYETAKQRLPGVVNWVNPADPNSWRTNWIMAIFADIGRGDLANQWQDGVDPNLTADQLKQKAGQVEQLVCPSNRQNAQPGGLSYIVNMGVYQTIGSSTNPDYSVRLFRDRSMPSVTFPSPEPDLSLVSLNTITRTVLLSKNLNAGPWYTLTTQPTADYGFNPVLSAVAFAWPNNYADYPTNSVWCMRTIGTPYSGDSTKFTPPLPPLLSSNHAGVIIVTFFDTHTEKIPTDTRCWKLDKDVGDMPSLNGSP